MIMVQNLLGCSVFINDGTNTGRVSFVTGLNLLNGTPLMDVVVFIWLKIW
jgi:hypothetical protein